MNSTAKTIILWSALLIAGVLLWQIVQRTQTGADQEKSFSEIMNKIDEGNVRSVEIMGSEVKGQFKDNTDLSDDGSELP